MSKKRKNSNYKGNAGGAAVKKGIDPDTKKNIIIWSVVGTILVALIATIVIALIPKSPKYVRIDFGDYGAIVVEVDRNEAPKTAKNFLNLVKSDFYDGLTIFRAQRNFVIQGGENENAELNPIKGEFAENGVENNISHKRGVISMARTNDPDSATSQFFITLHDNAAMSLDGKYAGFGWVVEGMDVVDKIAEDLFLYPINSMGFVSDSHAITIVSAEIIDYKK